MENNKGFTGNAECKFKDGSFYEGEWVNGLPEGYGTMVFANKDKYVGDWNEGKMNGVGIYRFYNSSSQEFSAVYRGEFVDGRREGRGKMTYANNDVYVGTWQNNMRTGSGVMWFRTGDRFSGLWKYDKMLRGVYCKYDGEKYDGEIKDGHFEGFGKYYWKDGNWFEGTFKQGQPYNGIVISADCAIAEYIEGELR